MVRPFRGNRIAGEAAYVEVADFGTPLQRCERVHRAGNGASHPEKDDPRAEITIGSALWSPLLWNDARLHRDKRTAHLNAVERAKGSVHKTCWAISQSCPAR